jgi:hypothetical protein
MMQKEDISQVKASRAIIAQDHRRNIQNPMTIPRQPER